MRQLLLSNSPFMAIVDDKNFERLSQFKWKYNGKIVRRFKSFTIKHYTKEGLYTKSTSEIKSIPLANEVMQIDYLMYDHKDRNPLNNLENNLRPANKQQNKFNTDKQKNCTSKYKGVSWYPRNNKWMAGIKIDGKNINLGYFEKETDAAIAYNNAIISVCKEFAVLNIIENSN